MKTSIKLFKSINGAYFSADMLPILCFEYVEKFIKPLPNKIELHISRYAFKGSKRVKICSIMRWGAEVPCIVWLDKMSIYSWRSTFKDLDNLIYQLLPPKFIGDTYIYVKICAPTQT